MKSERRHELQTNSLALWLRWKGPEYWEKHGSKVLLVLVLIALGVVLIKWRIEAPKTAAIQAGNELAAARSLLQDFRLRMISNADAGDIPVHVKNALVLSDKPEVQAQAYNLRGEYEWILATAPPESTSRPTTAIEQAQAEHLKSAQDDYEKTLSVKDAPADLLATAQISLGKIEEQLGGEEMSKAGQKLTPGAEAHFAKAKQHYDAVINSPNMLQLQKEFARVYATELEKLQKPVWIVSEKTATTRGFLDIESEAPNTTRPAATQAHPATKASAGTRPVAPATTPSGK
jgi:hypothetical protein